MKWLPTSLLLMCGWSTAFTKPAATPSPTQTALIATAALADYDLHIDPTERRAVLEALVAWAWDDGEWVEAEEVVLPLLHAARAIDPSGRAAALQLAEAMRRAARSPLGLLGSCRLAAHFGPHLPGDAYAPLREDEHRLLRLDLDRLRRSLDGQTDDTSVGLQRRLTPAAITRLLAEFDALDGPRWPALVEARFAPASPDEPTFWLNPTAIIALRLCRARYLGLAAPEAT